MKAYCVSHRKDVDGLSSCSMAVAATGGEAILSEYDDMVDNLRRVPDGADRLVVTDLGADTAEFPGFLAEMKRVAAHAEVTYIDHHYMSETAKRSLRRAGVRVVHDVRECASMLTYRTFRERLPERARFNALFGAVTDYMDDSPMARNMMEKGDRQFVLLEATMLSLALGAKNEEPGYPESVVAQLAAMKLPHEIPGVPEAAVLQLAREAALEGEVRKRGTKLGRLAYMVTDQYSTGSVAKLLIGAFDVPVGVSMKERTPGWYEVSLRGTSECRVHLGKTIGKIVAKMGGSGGGHAKAAGCRLPVARADEMLRALSGKV